MMYCNKCGGERAIIVGNADGYTKEICPECDGSGLNQHIDLMAEMIAYGTSKEGTHEQVAFHVHGFPEEWTTEGKPMIIINQGNMFIRLQQELTPDGQPKNSRLPTQGRNASSSNTEGNG